MCTVEHLGAILSGKKKTMTNEEVVQVVIPQSLYITKKVLVEQIKSNPELMQYFPDDMEEHCDR